MRDQESKAGNVIYEARWAGCGMNLQEAAAWLGVHMRTLDRQERGEARPSGPIVRALELRSGNLGEIHPDWADWWLCRDGRLRFQGERRGYSPGEILALPLLYQLRSALERRIEEMKAQEALITASNEGIFSELVKRK